MTAPLTKRTKVIFFRVSEPELLEIQKKCDELGLRSVSECARVAIKGWVCDSDPQPDQVLRDLVQKLDAALQILQAIGPANAATGS